MCAQDLISRLYKHHLNEVVQSKKTCPLKSNVNALKYAFVKYGKNVNIDHMSETTHKLSHIL